MVYKIRNKSFFFTISGNKNNYANKVLNIPIEVKSEMTFAVKSYDGGPEYIRFYQLYRNISRKLKQYLYGNKKAEEHVMLILREHFKIPYTCETPIHLIQSEPLRRLLNQGDRDYELMSYNTHPYQLGLYKDINEEIQKEEENQNLKLSGEQIVEEKIADQLAAQIKIVQEKYEGRAPLDVLDQVMRESYRNYLTMVGINKNRNTNGDFDDFLEKLKTYNESTMKSNNVKTQ